MPDNRELPEGARQSKVNGELASEQPAEGLPRFIWEISEISFSENRLCRFGRNIRRIKGQSMAVLRRA